MTEEPGIEFRVRHVKFDVRRDKGHAVENVRPEQPDAVPDEWRAEFDREELYLVLDRQLAVRLIAPDIRLVDRRSTARLRE